VIEGQKLPLEENLWLKGLTKDLNAKTARSILEESRKRGKEAEIAAYMYALINANQKTIEEALIMAGEELPFDKWVEETGLAAKWEARGEVRGEKNGWEKALKFLEEGHTVEELKRMSPPAPKSN
jgi:predicted transposase YdaD